MRIELCPVVGVREVAENTFVLSFLSAGIAAEARPGQFLNIRVDERCDPLLRRPFSVYRVEEEAVEVVFNVVGRGTGILSRKRMGDTVDVLGPLGVPFRLDGDDFDTGVLIGGGLGVAPLPVSTAVLKAAGKRVLTFLGARSARALVRQHLENLQVATDDGSEGYHGTVVELAAAALARQQVPRPKLFACGPTAMLRAVGELAAAGDVPCEVSLEGPMACGIGICQGCPVELRGEGTEKRYALMCTDGPTFDVRKVRL